MTDKNIDRRFWNDVLSSIDELTALNQGYDSGQLVLGRSIATTVHRLLFDELPPSRASHLPKFGILGFELDKRNLMKFHGLVAMQIANLDFHKEKYWSEVEFIPILFSTTDRKLKYKEYLKSPAIYYRRMDRLFSRKDIIQLARNKASAHNDRNKGDEFELAFATSLSAIPMRVLPDGTEIDTISHPNAFRQKGSPLAAMMRTMSEEIVRAINTCEVPPDQKQ